MGHSFIKVGHGFIKVGHGFIKVGHGFIKVGHSFIKVDHSFLGHGLLGPTNIANFTLVFQVKYSFDRLLNDSFNHSLIQSLN